MLRVIILLGLLLICTGCLAPAETPRPSLSMTAERQSTPAEDAFTQARQAMVREQIELRGVGQASVLEAMRQVERHRFVPEDYLEQAYDDHPLPIGYGQTISQPYIVALMSESLGVEAGDRVLEIGTGSGYQAAVLAEMGVEVYSVEIVPELASLAAQRLAELGYDGVEVLAADGYFGWEEHAPYDAIIVTAAPDHLPQPLANQLAEGGRLVIPIGPVGMVQTLWQFEMVGGELEATNLGAVRFVPFTRESSDDN